MIRPATLEDVPGITELAVELFTLHQTFDSQYYALEEHPQNDIAQWIRGQLPSISSFLFVAEEEGQVAGIIAGYLKPLYPWFKIKSVGHLSFLIVSPSFRKRGIAKALEQKAAEWFKQRELPYVEVFVEEKNLTGQAAWSSFGFKPFRKFLRKEI